VSPAARATRPDTQSVPIPADQPRQAAGREQQGPSSEAAPDQAPAAFEALADSLLEQTISIRQQNEELIGALERLQRPATPGGAAAARRPVDPDPEAVGLAMRLVATEMAREGAARRDIEAALETRFGRAPASGLVESVCEDRG
jgi:hypothetical protein